MQFLYLLFQDFGLRGAPFVIVFAIIYVMSDMTYTMNDIAYWSMYSTFTTDPKEREKLVLRQECLRVLECLLQLLS